MQAFKVPEEEVFQFEKELRCLICKEILNDPRATNCHHLFCRECVQHKIDGNNKCPICKMPVYRNELQKVQVLSNIVDLYKRLMFLSEPKRMPMAAQPEVAASAPLPRRSALKAKDVEDEDLFRPPAPKKAKKVTFHEGDVPQLGSYNHFRSPPPALTSSSPKQQASMCSLHASQTDPEGLEAELLHRILKKFDPQLLKEKYGYEPLEELNAEDTPAPPERPVAAAGSPDGFGIDSTSGKSSVEWAVAAQQPAERVDHSRAVSRTAAAVISPNKPPADEVLHKSLEGGQQHSTPARPTQPPVAPTPTSEGASTTTTTPGSEGSLRHSSPSRWGPRWAQPPSDVAPEARRLFGWSRSTKSRRTPPPPSPAGTAKGSSAAPKASPPRPKFSPATKKTSPQRPSHENAAAPAVRTRSSEFVLYCWGLSEEDAAVVRKGCQRLGGRLVPFFQPSVTHVVIGALPSEGTVGPALATAANARLVLATWIRESLQRAEWLPEDPYEAYPGGSANKAAVALAKQENPRLLDKCSVLLYGTFGGPDLPCLADLEHLIRACGGQVLSDEKFGNLMAAKRNDKKAGVTIVVPKASEARHARDLGVGRVVTAAWLLDAVCRWDIPRT